jgi:uncharacterized membrane protein YfcA
MVTTEEALLLAGLFFAAAILYSSVGHGGASGYLASMGLVGVAPAIMRPTALVMNIAVASISLVKFARANGFRWRLAWFGALVGVVLLYSAVRLFTETMTPKVQAREVTGPPPVPLALVLGAGIGLLSGLTGVGGGIFLSPLLVLAGWATVRDSAAPTAAFILINSIAGLLGLLTRQPTLPDPLPYWVLAVIAGGLIGASFGARRLDNRAMRRALAAVLLIAGGKMVA